MIGQKATKTIFLILALTLLVGVLSACNLLDDIKQPTPKVTEASIALSDGLTKRENGEYIALVGQKFTLEAKVNEGAPEQISYKWYLAVDGTKTQIGEDKTLSYTFAKFDNKKYEISVSADGVDGSNTIVITLNYAENLTDVKLCSSTHSIFDGAIQEKVDNITKVELYADWNRDALPKDAQVNIAWSVGENLTAESTDESFSFTPDGLGVYTVKLTLSYKDDVQQLAVKIFVIEDYEAIQSMSLVIEYGAEALGEGLETQYYQSVNSENRDEISVSLSAEPIGRTDYTVPVKWIVRDKNGERVMSENGRQLKFVPAYGETIVKAIVDNVESKQITVFAFTEADYEKNRKYINDIFLWEDGVENAYITDQTDLNRFVQHAFSERKVFDNSTGTREDGFSFGVASNFDFVQTGNNAPLETALHSIDESGKISINTGWQENKVTGDRSDYILYVMASSKFMEPEKNYSPATDVHQDETAIVHYSELDENKKRTALPIDDNAEYNVPIKNSQMLYRVIGWGYKPTFDGSKESQKMKNLYEKIRQVAIDYMTDGMTDYEKVLIIYEWIAQTVDYDYAITEVDFSQNSTESLQYNAFSLEGVFCDADGEGYGQAVCDGRAKAFVALCGVEDITAVRVTGESIVSGGNEPHAWNKVLIDINGDGKKEWFMCDTTWSDRSSAEDRTERLNKQYFLVTDEYIKNSHIADKTSKNPACTTTFDYYANTVIGSGEESFDLYINEENTIFGNAELKKAASYAKENGKMLEIKVSTSVCSTANELKAMLGGLDRYNADIYTISNTSSEYGIYIIIFN